MALALLATIPSCGTTPDGQDEAPGETSDEQIEIQAEQIAVGEFVFDAYTVGPEDGELVLLIHGFPQSAAEWTEQLMVLGREGYRAVAYNQRGYSPGARPDEVEAYTTIALAGDAVGIADALGVDDFHVVGHDWGAAVAWRVAALAPDRVETLTTLSVSHPDAYGAAFADPESCQSEAGSYIIPFLEPGYEDVLLADDAALLREFLAELDPAQIEAHLEVVGDPEALAAALKYYRAAFALPGSGASTGEIMTPTTMIWGDQDPYICVDSILATEDFMTGPYALEIVEGEGHWLPEVKADEVTALILDRLEG